MTLILHFRNIKNDEINKKMFNLRVPSNLAAIVSRKVFWGASRPFLATILFSRVELLFN